MSTDRPKIGFTCAYTPLPLIDAAGFAPYRILPMSNAPEAAGQVLHENLCPHIKRILDRALDNDLPEMAGVVFLNSCDAMNRLSDGWKAVRPNERMVLVDLPVIAGETAVSYFARQLAELAGALSEWSGREVSSEKIGESIEKYNRSARFLEGFRVGLRNSSTSIGAVRLQALYNQAVTLPFGMSREFCAESEGKLHPASINDRGVPIFAFGNVLPDPDGFGLFEACGARVVDADFCTGCREFAPVEMKGPGDMLTQFARGIMSRPRCARMLDSEKPGGIAEEVLERAISCGARGVIACAAKFCDPYISRIPGVREVLRKAGMPLLQIEGDCSMRSLGQQRTRIEAFTEMLGR